MVERIKIARHTVTFLKIVNTKQLRMNKPFVEGQISSLETKIRYAEIVNSDSVADE